MFFVRRFARGLLVCAARCAAESSSGQHVYNNYVYTNDTQVKETARRMMTNFSVQASVGDFYTAQRLLKDPGAKALPQVGTGMLSCNCIGHPFWRPVWKLRCLWEMI